MSKNLEVYLERVSADEYALLQAYRICPIEVQQDIRLFAWAASHPEIPTADNVVAFPKKS